MNQQIDNRIEKRHHRRKDHHKLVILESLQIGINTDSRMINCSDDGLYFESDQLLLPGTKIFIRIENFPHGQTETYICHHAKIIWGQRLDHTHYAYGYGAKYVEYSNKQESSETESDQIEELRKHPRKYCAKPATLRFEKKSFDGFISDISRGGCFLENTERLNSGQILDLVIPGTRFSENNRLKVEVVRLSPIGVGIKFKRIIKKNPK
jgi:hypothetical protein